MKSSKSPLRSLGFGGVLLISISQAFGQIVVYDDTGGTEAYYTYSSPSLSVTAGDQVTLAGTERTLTEFTVGLFATPDPNSGSTTADLGLYFYNLGTGNQVGTEIGSVVTRTGIPLGNGAFSFTFSGLSLTLPDTFIWAVSISNSGTATVGWTYSGTPTVGSSDDTFAYVKELSSGLPLGTGTYTNPSLVNNLSATITAVPEPSTYAVVFGLLSAGFAAARACCPSARRSPKNS